jgi:hypothetical protein
VSANSTGMLHRRQCTTASGFTIAAGIEVEISPEKEGIGRHSQGVGVLDVGLEHLERVLVRLAHGADDHLLRLPSRRGGLLRPFFDRSSSSCTPPLLQASVALQPHHGSSDRSRGWRGMACASSSGERSSSSPWRPALSFFSLSKWGSAACVLRVSVFFFSSPEVGISRLCLAR